MKVLIFAAGYGTRLKPYTDNMPKALVPVNGKPLLQWQIEHLKNFGFNEFIVNIHHLGYQIVDFLKANDNFGCNILISDETDELRDTGGGLMHASRYLKNGESFLIHNVDIVSGVNFNDMYKAHLQSGVLATLAVSSRNATRCLWFDENMNLCAWENIITQKKIIAKNINNPQKFAYSGIQIMSPDIFKIYHKQGVFSIIDMMLEVAKIHEMKAFVHDSSEFMDVGITKHLETAGELLIKINY